MFAVAMMSSSPLIAVRADAPVRPNCAGQLVRRWLFFGARTGDSSMCASIAPCRFGELYGAHASR
jgi:hypothetical protein